MRRNWLFVTLGLAACDPLLVQPTPELQAIAPELVCHEIGTTTMTVTGRGFTPALVDAISGPAALEKPELQLVLQSDPVGGAASGARTLTTEDGLRWHSSSELRFEVRPDQDLDDGVYGLSLTNPDGQTTSLDAALLAVSAPVVTDVAPILFCGEQQPVEVVIQGEGFLEIEGETPTVRIGTWSGPAEVDACSPLVGPAEGQRCATLRVTLDPGELPPGVHDVQVTNPAPVGCASSEAFEVEVVAAPRIDEIRPDSVCIDGEPALTAVIGSGFLFVDGEAPTIWVDGEARLPESRDACTPLAGPTAGEVCGELYLTIDPAIQGLGDVEFHVTNPEPAACETETPGTMAVVPPPTIEDIEPDRICDIGGSFTIHGTSFVDGSEVFVGGVPAASVIRVDDTRLEVTIDGPLPPGLATVEVRNPDGCSAIAEASIEVVRTPILFYVDPPVAYSGISVQATMFVAGISGELTDVWLIHADTGARVDLDFSWDGGSTVLATLPAGLDAGSYDAFALQDTSCPFTLPGAVTVTDDLDVAIDRIEPEFAWTEAFTATQIFAEDPAPDGKVQFADVPRVYLNPVDGGTATALRSVSLQSATQIDATVPPGLDPGAYDVIVVNPDGKVGLLSEGLLVTEEAPPLVTSVAPASVPFSSDATLTFQGANFRDPTFEMVCRDVADGTIDTARAGTVTRWDATTLVGTIPSTLYSSAQVCVLRVENSDGTWFEYAAVSITNPAQNLNSWRDAPALVEARRAPAVAAGRASPLARFVYAVGGDNGAPASARSTIEVARITRFGDLGEWSLLEHELPAARTLAGVAQDGRFLYVIGGHDGTGAVDTVWRAEVLDPLDSPRYDDLAVAYGEGEGLGGGTWIYRIAALFPDDDPTNPGGESLAGDPIVVRLPDLEDRLHLDLTWTAVDGASGYRVYRSATADAGSGAEVWLTDVTTNRLFDDGLTTTSEQEPLPLGALGRWAALPPLPVPLEAPCATLATDPTDPSVRYLYVAGGRSAGTPRTEVRSLDLALDDDGEPVVGSWRSTSGTLTTGRHQCGAWTVDERLHTVVDPGESWVYFGGGLTAGGATGVVQTGRVAEGGDLTGWSTAASMTPARAGFGVLSSGNQLYAFGGQNGRPHASGVSALVTGPPALGNWNNLGTSLREARYLAGSAQESAVILVVGGETGSAAASRAVDITNY